jgi:hypothetical protein
MKSRRNMQSTMASSFNKVNLHNKINKVQKKMECRKEQKKINNNN